MTFNGCRFAASDVGRFFGVVLALRVAATGVVIAASVNSLTKGGMAAVIGGQDIGLRVGLPLLASAIGGLVSAWLWIW